MRRGSPVWENYGLRVTSQWTMAPRLMPRLRAGGFQVSALETYIVQHFVKSPAPAAMVAGEAFGVLVGGVLFFAGEACFVVFYVDRYLFSTLVNVLWFDARVAIMTPRVTVDRLAHHLVAHARANF